MPTIKRKLYCENCDLDFVLIFESKKPISVCPFCAEEISFIDEDEELGTIGIDEEDFEEDINDDDEDDD